MGRSSRLVVVATLLVAIASPAWAQFGQNKINYQNFDWQVYPSPHFDVHYYPAIEPFLEEVVSYAESSYLEISNQLDHELRFRVPLVIYKTHGEFLQTNITMAKLPEGVGAFAEPVQYRMVLPIDGPPDKLYQLIAHELTHIFQYSMFYEGYLGRALRSNPPAWIMEGLASYLGKDEDNIDRMVIRDAVVNNILPPVQALSVVTFLTYRYGHAIFDFIEQEHGEEGLRSFLFEFKKVLLTGNLGKAIKEAFGHDIDEFNRRFNRYLRKKYFPVLLEKKSPDEYGDELKIKRGGVWTASPSLSPSGELIAALAAPTGMELDLVILSAEDGEMVSNLTKGFSNNYRNLVTEVFAGRRDLSWSPTSDHVAVFVRRENQWPLLIFDALTGKLLHDIEFDDIFECASPMFSPDGRHVAFEGNRNGIVDIFEYDLDDGSIRNLTQDEFFDANPWYAADGESLLYNRRIGSHWKIFSVDLADASKKTQLTIGASSDLQPSYSRDGKTIFYASDRGDYGVFNIHSLDLETGDLQQYTDVVGGCFGPVEMAPRDDENFVVYTAFFEGTFRLYRMPLRTPELKIAAADRLSTPLEAEPFEPDLRLAVDEEKKVPYKLKWDIEAPSVSVGVADDGTFLSNLAVSFTDLLGNHRFIVTGASVSDFQQYNATYINLKRRYNWGATLYDFRDFFVEQSTGIRFKREYKQTGATAFIQYPISEHYRFQVSAGAVDSAINRPALEAGTGNLLFFESSDRLALIGASITGDTTRYQSFGPFQGKRFNIGATHGIHLSGDFDGDFTDYRADFRFYKKATRRSVLAWRIASVYNTGDRENTYGFGGLNQLRGWGFRDFIGSRLAWSNLEFRFPLIDELRFPILALRQIRGFFFFDVGAAWLDNDLWYDPEVGLVRTDLSSGSAVPIGFKFWDSDENRLQDGRASYGVGFQFFFIGGLQFNWVWSHRLDYTQYRYFDELTGIPLITPIPEKAEDVGTRADFYIQFDF